MSAPPPGMGPLELAAVVAAAIVAGAVNAIAGGGTLVAFPVLMAVGVPALAANITCTVALCPGHFGATLAQAELLRGQRALVALLVPAGIAGGLAGGLLLLHTGEQTFREVVPLLLAASALLLAAQDRVRDTLAERIRRRGVTDAAHAHASRLVAPLVVAAASVYGGYFGAGLGVVLVAVLGIVVDEPLPRINALKQVVALVANIAAALFFVFSGGIDWLVVGAMAAGALAGGALGGRIATRIDPAALRRVIVAIGFVLAAVYLVR